MSAELVVLIGITLVAAAVNGALGYGFSSITVPVALLFYTNRILNPALVLLEVAINAYVLVVNRASVPAVWKRVLPLVVGLMPGVIMGSSVLYWVDAGWLKFVTFAVLLPLILLQAAGVRRAIRAERTAGLALGVGVGTLYAVTTVSGPPLALMLNNQGFAKQQFRAALGVIRLAESSLTAAAYYSLGLYSIASLRLVPYILPSILVGIPVGAWLFQHTQPETFRRLCMSFDAWVVGFGLSVLLRSLNLVASPGAFTVLAVVIVIDSYLLWRFFSDPQSRRSALAENPSIRKADCGM